MDVSLENLSSSQKDELMSTIKQKIAIANAQELVTKMTEKCFKKCVGKPGQDLDGSEQVYGLVECSFPGVNTTFTPGTIQRIREELIADYGTDVIIANPMFSRCDLNPKWHHAVG